MLRYLLTILMLFLTLLASACGAPPLARHLRTLVVYSELDDKFTESLVQDYNEHNKKGITLRAIYELKPGAELPDIVLSDASVLQRLKNEHLLRQVTCLAGDSLPASCRDEDEYWYGAFYDPVVFLVNQQYARRAGQENLKGWADLPKTRAIRIVMQNLSNSAGTREFLASMASNMGEQPSLNYLLQISPADRQYAKFPFTPVRMTAVGDADLAVTRQSFVFKYLDNNFPAYLVFPKEGTPVELYGAAVFKDCKYPEESAAFLDWLISSDGVKRISQINNTGFMFLLPQGLQGNAVDHRLLWLNTGYRTEAAREALIAKWLDTVRFNGAS